MFRIAQLSGANDGSEFKLFSSLLIVERSAPVLRHLGLLEQFDSTRGKVIATRKAWRFLLENFRKP